MALGTLFLAVFVVLEVQEWLARRAARRRDAEQVRLHRSWNRYRAP